MIKLGMMARATDESVFHNHVQFAHELGLDVIDFHLSGLPRDPDFLRRIKILCMKHGLPIGYLGSGSFVGPEKEMCDASCAGQGRYRLGSLSSQHK